MATKYIASIQAIDASNRIALSRIVDPALRVRVTSIASLLLIALVILIATRARLGYPARS